MPIKYSLDNKSDDQLVRIRRNAFDALESSDDPKRQDEAGALLNAIEAELERRHLPGMIEYFRERYPGGFYGEKYLNEERNYKVAASETLNDIFNQESVDELVSTDNWDELNSRTKQLVNMTNMIQGSFERPKLFDALAHEKGGPSLLPGVTRVPVWRG